MMLSLLKSILKLVDKDKPVNLEFRIVISLIMFYLNIMDYSMSFLSLSTWNDL